MFFSLLIGVSTLLIIIYANKLDGNISTKNDLLSEDVHDNGIIKTSMKDFHDSKYND